MRIRFIGRRDWRVPRRLIKRQDESDRADPATTARSRFTIAFNYGGRAEIVDAVRALVAEGTPADKIDEQAIRRHLYDPEMPDPDLVIRTSGEYRISNFLLWELAYSELIFTDVLWPDFRREPPLRGGPRVPAPRPALRRHRPTSGPGVSLYRDTGIVLRTYKLGEADRIVVLLTAAHGKVRAVAKGVRKTKSRFGGRLEPLSPREPAALPGPRARRRQPGRDARPLPRRSTTTCDRLTRGIAMLEAVDQVAQEREPNPRLYQMLVGALRTLADRRQPARGRRLLLEAARRRGLQPELDACVELRRRPSRSSPSTSTRVACCAARAGGAWPSAPRPSSSCGGCSAASSAGVLRRAGLARHPRGRHAGGGGHGAPHRASPAQRRPTSTASEQAALRPVGVRSVALARVECCSQRLADRTRSNAGVEPASRGSRRGRAGLSLRRAGGCRSRAR